MPTPRLTERCGLCNFKLDCEDIVIVVKEDGEKSEPLPFHPWARSENDDEVAQLDNAHPVCPDLDQCAHPFEEGVGCHPSCLRIVDGASLDRVLQLSAWSFQPSPRLERARHRWLREELTSRLGISLPLPVELRRDVAGHLIQEFVVAKNASLSLCDRAAVSNVSVASAITETYTTFEGRQYLQSIKNAPVSDDGWVPPEVVYVAEDHAGIKQVILGNDFIKVSEVPEPRQMSVFRHNDPDIIGYSICCNPTVLALHTHYRFHDDLSCYESTPGNAAWIYMPIQKYERIDHIWVRWHRSSNDKKALAFEMNSGRLLFFGRHKTWTLDEHKYQWILLFSSREEPVPGLSLFFFDSLMPFCIRELGFDPPCPSSPRTPGTPVLTSPPLSLPADPEFLDNPHWSCTSVEDVVEVVPCRQTVKGETMITGLLLHYSDGNKASLGHMRLDRLDIAIAVDYSQKLYLGFNKTKDGHCYIAKVELSTRELDDDMDEWFEVSWSGTLEWCFSYQECHVWKSDSQGIGAG